MRPHHSCSGSCASVNVDVFATSAINQSSWLSVGRCHCVRDVALHRQDQLLLNINQTIINTLVLTTRAVLHTYVSDLKRSNVEFGLRGPCIKTEPKAQNNHKRNIQITYVFYTAEFSTLNWTHYYV
jgi:hypothetical protein